MDTALRRDGRVVDGGGLENRCPALRDRGFESLSLRHPTYYLGGSCIGWRLVSSRVVCCMIAAFCRICSSFCRTFCHKRERALFDDLHSVAGVLRHVLDVMRRRRGDVAVPQQTLGCEGVLGFSRCPRGNAATERIVALPSDAPALGPTDHRFLASVARKHNARRA